MSTTSSGISTDVKSDDGIGQTPIAENNASRYQVVEATGDCNLSPTHKRNDSFNTCSLSAEVVDDDIGSFVDQDDQSPSICEAGQDEDEEPQTPQGVDRILTVDMFSRFATAYTYPIDGEYDDEYSSDDDDDKATGISIERISLDNDNELGENKYCRQNRNRCDTGLDGEKFIENQDDDDNDGGDPLPYQDRRGHHRVNSLPWTMDETKDVSTPPSKDKSPVTPSPQKPVKKRAPAMLSRSLSMSNTDLNGRYGDEAVPPSDARTPPRPPCLNARAATEGTSHRRIVSAHSPLSNMLEIASLSASPKPPLPTSLSGGCSPRLRPRVGMPPRPSGQPITLSPQLSWSQPERTSLSFSAAPQDSGGSTVQHHFRTLSYESFKAMQDASDSVYLSQAFVGTSPDPSLLGSRPRHHTRSHSLDSRSTVMSTKSKDSAASEMSQADLDAERIWSDYYEQKMVQKNYVKDELKYRLSKAMPKVFVKRLSLSSPPALKRANSAKFV